MPRFHQQTNRYTVADYMQWPDRLRCELIHGEIYDMSPAPTLAHQDVVLGLSTVLRNDLSFRRGDGGPPSPCHVFVSPVDVVLGQDTVVQPDIALVCDPAKLANGRYIDGAPDLVVEVLSPATALKDRREKLKLYESVGVKEYLIVDPVEYYMEAYRLGANGVYERPLLLGPADAFQSIHFPEITRTLSELFGWPQEEEGVSPPV
jgi:Uma2 family endonuclease